jgi:hypothetical protein
VSEYSQIKPVYLHRQPRNVLTRAIPSNPHAIFAEEVSCTNPLTFHFHLTSPNFRKTHFTTAHSPSASWYSSHSRAPRIPHPSPSSPPLHRTQVSDMPPLIASHPSDSHLLDVPDEEHQRGRKRRRSSGNSPPPPPPSSGSTAFRGRRRHRSVSQSQISSQEDPVTAGEKTRSQSWSGRTSSRGRRQKKRPQVPSTKKRRSQSPSRSRGKGEEERSPRPRRKRTRSRSRNHDAERRGSKVEDC